jgi:2-methylcitrate dehydratase PrpD
VQGKDMQDFNAKLAAFIADARLETIDPTVIDKAQKVIADTFAAILSGAGSEVAPPLLRYAGAVEQAGSCVVIGTPHKVPAECAALINGSFGAALDFDDVLSMMPGHPSAVVIPALCTVFPSRTVSGRDFIEAYIVGVEVGAKLAVGIGLGHYKRGFHGTGTLCLFSAVAALAKLKKLPLAVTSTALSIAASTSSGLQANFGTMTKPLHSGLAARSAVTAVALAEAGFTASPAAITGKHGFFATYGTEASDPAKTLAGLGRPWTVADPGIALKKFACCYANFRGMDGLLSLKAELDLSLTTVERIACRVPPGSLIPLPYSRPRTGLESKFSMPYALAATLVDTPLTITTFTDTGVARPWVEDLLSRIDVREDIACTTRDPGYEARSYGSRGHVEVEVWTRDGRHGRREVDIAPGHPDRELGWADIEAKYADCASYAGVSTSRSDMAFAKLRNLAGEPSVSAVVELMRTGTES